MGKKRGDEMQQAELSIVIPVKNVEKTIGGVLRSIASQIVGMDVEVIVVDMESRDRTILEGYQLFKELGLQGGVVRNGDNDPGSALNTGLQRANGTFVTFLFLHRLYRDFLNDYLQTARQGADVVFGCDDAIGVRAAERRVISAAVKSNTGADFACEMVRGNLTVDPAALMVRQAFLDQHHIQFREGIRYGMEEEFVFRCLISGDTVLQAPVIPEKDTIFGGRYWGGALDSKETASASVPGKEIFESVDAMIRIYDFIRLQHRQKDELLMLFRYQKFPESVMKCVDELLRQGLDYRFIKGCIKRGDYQRLLETDGKVTEVELKRRVGMWKRLPWLYQPK
ncbi:MAG: glycosyltransferase family 2 protein [Clostridiales bacterium]|nr:glycosyltransferase family 2 protein [Clostridiales bacterium]